MGIKSIDTRISGTYLTQTDVTQHKHLIPTGRTGYGKNINIVFVLFDKF